VVFATVDDDVVGNGDIEDGVVLGDAGGVPLFDVIGVGVVAGVVTGGVDGDVVAGGVDADVVAGGVLAGVVAGGVIAGVVAGGVDAGGMDGPGELCMVVGVDTSGVG